MKDETYKYIWNEIILKTIASLENLFTEEDKAQYGFSIRNLKSLEKNIFSDYNSIKRQLKRDYYDASKSDRNPKNRIDNHKIAACICYSLLQNKVFIFEVHDGMPKNMFTINYELAYTVSLGFIFTTLVAQYKNIGREDLANKLLEQQSLVVPITSAGHDEYHDGRIRTLALNDVYGNTFDVLMYSDMMFWIEYYNRQTIEQTLVPISLNKEDY